MTASSTTAWLGGLGQKLAIAGTLKTPNSSGWNFVSGATATYNATTGYWDITLAGGSGGHTIEDEGIALTARTSLNFVGVNVSVADSGGKTVVTIGAVSLAGSQVTGTLPITRGGTGLGALGSALQAIRVNAAATALEFYTPAGGLTVPGGDGFRFTYSTTTTDADPGAGTFRANNATWASVTTLYVDLAEFGTTDVTAWLDSLATKGRLRIASIADPTKWVVFNVTAWTTAVGYRKLTVAYVAGPGGIPTTAGDSFVSFDANGGVIAGNGLTGTSTHTVLAENTTIAVGAAGIKRAAITGDVTIADGSNAATIANDAVTYAKMQNVSATDRVLGRDTAGAGDVEELTVGGGIEFTGSTGLQISTNLPARGTNNASVDLAPSGQTKGSLATASSITLDIAVSTNKWAIVTFSVRCHASNVVKYIKTLQVYCQNAAGVVTIDNTPTLAETQFEGAVWTLSAAVSGTNVRATLTNSSGSTRTYSLIGGKVEADLS
jgi:hypothetical protein